MRARHDANNLLLVIRGNAELILMGDGCARDKESAEAILEAARRLEAIVAEKIPRVE